MRIKSITLAKGILSFAAFSLITSCVDDKYDLTHIDTTSEFKVDDLTVPINLETLKLKNIIDIDINDDSLVQLETVNGQDIYTIKQGGDIEPTEFSLGKVSVPKVDINSISVSPNLTGIPSGVGIPITSLKKAFDLPLGDNGLQDYNFNFENIDEHLKSLDKIETSTIEINVTLTIPGGLLNGNNKISFTDLSLLLPKELMNVSCEVGTYHKDTHKLSIPIIPVGSDGKANLVITASGLSLGEQGIIGDSHELHISGKIGLETAKIDFDVAQVVIDNPFIIDINYSLSGFDVLKFSGEIDYPMNDINIDPISLSDLPDFLNNPETNIIIAEPAIYVMIENPVGQYGLNGHGTITLTSNFNSGSVEHKGNFNLQGTVSKLAFCADKNFKPSPKYADYVPTVIDGLDKILTNGEDGLPKNINVSITNLKFDGYIDNLPLGNLGAASGNYNFFAPFAFGKGSKIYYNTTESGWGSDDLDDVNITLLQLHALCTSKLPVDIELKIQPIDKDGKKIDVVSIEKDENGKKIEVPLKPFHVPANCTNELATLSLAGKGGLPINNFDGVIFEATILQNSPEAQALGPNIELELKDLRVTVDGYYKTKL